jgi:hypothetical protein
MKKVCLASAVAVRPLPIGLVSNFFGEITKGGTGFKEHSIIRLR